MYISDLRQAAMPTPQHSGEEEISASTANHAKLDLLQATVRFTRVTVLAQTPTEAKAPYVASVAGWTARATLKYKAKGVLKEKA